MKEHWADQTADALMGKTNAIATGTSISGVPHLGNANDVIRGSVIDKILKQRGVKSELIWISDNMDPLRKTPENIKQYKEYLGYPYSDIPDFEGCHKTFAEHYEEMLLKQLSKLGVEPTVMKAREMYKKGLYNESIKTAFEKRNEIIEIMNRFRETPLPANWQPYTAICEKCGKIGTTNVTGYDGEWIYYECSDKTISESEMKGCGFKGKTKISDGNGKLAWRIEWPARWQFLKITCEPFGKEHAAAGGSWDTGKLISEKIFNYPPPEPVIYEHFQIKGGKMSKSKGNTITVDDWLEVMPKETLMFFLVSGDINTSKNIDLKEITPLLMENFYKCEKTFYEGEGEEREKYVRIYELSVEKPPAKLPIQLSYGFASLIAQVALTEEQRTKILKRTGHYEEEQKEKLLKIIELAGNWVKKYQPEQQTINFTPGILNEEEKKIVENFIQAYKKMDLKEACSAATENGTTNTQLFQAIYKAIFNKTKGPRLTSLEEALSKEELIKKIENARPSQKPWP